MISTEKQTLRLRMMEWLRAMSAGERAEKSAAIAGHLATGLGDAPGLVFGFAPMRFEPDWTAAIDSQWDVALPRVCGAALHFHRVADFSALLRGPLGAREPLEGRILSPGEAGVVLTPGLAFDPAGRRMGRGGGFYDRFLESAALKARRVAVCFAGQIVERVPVESHDAEVDAIVTERGWIEARNSARGRD